MKSVLWLPSWRCHFRDILHDNMLIIHETWSRPADLASAISITDRPAPFHFPDTPRYLWFCKRSAGIPVELRPGTAEINIGWFPGSRITASMLFVRRRTWAATGSATNLRWISIGVVDFDSRLPVISIDMEADPSAVILDWLGLYLGYFLHYRNTTIITPVNLCRRILNRLLTADRAVFFICFYITVLAPHTICSLRHFVIDKSFTICSCYHFQFSLPNGPKHDEQMH